MSMRNQGYRKTNNDPNYAPTIFRCLFSTQTNLSEVMLMIYPELDFANDSTYILAVCLPYSAS